MNPHDILVPFPSFIDGVLAGVAGYGIDVSGLAMDHVGYQTASDAEYDRLAYVFASFGTLVSEDVVGGRRVGIYALREALRHGRYVIGVIELVAPKAGQECPSGFEHAEFVTGEPLAAFMVRYPRVPWDTSAMEQPVFPMLKLRLTETTQVKFHVRPVLDIIAGNQA